MTATKHILDYAIDHTEAQGWELQRNVLPKVFASNDAREGATAFAVKRAARWTGT